MVTRNVPAHALMTGVPARLAGWMSCHGDKLALPLKAAAGQAVEAQCPSTGERYRLLDDQVSRVP